MCFSTGWIFPEDAAPMRHDARTVANRFIALAKGKGDAVTPMQVNKLTYLAHGWMLGLFGRPLVRQHVEAWRYGPVVADVYHELKHFRDQPVTDAISSAPNEQFDAEQEHVVAEVYRVYGSLSGPALSHLTHKPGTPWTTTWAESGQNGIISNDLIEAHYKALAAARRAA